MQCFCFNFIAFFGNDLSLKILLEVKIHHVCWRDQGALTEMLFSYKIMNCAYRNHLLKRLGFLYYVRDFDRN